MSKIESVLPLKVHAREGASDLERFSTLLLTSFDRFLPRDLIMITLIVPPSDLPAVNEYLAALGRSDVRAVCEDNLCPSLKGYAGWHKQQIIKLAAAKIVSSDYYLTLDADVLLKRPATAEHFFPSGKPILQKMKASVHWDWWTASRRVLKTQVPLEQDSLVMGVTPEFMHRDTCIELQGAIASRNNATDWDRFLFDVRDAGWTEYTLYWLYVLEHGLDHTLYDWSPFQMYEGIWERKERDRLARKSLQRIFALDSTSFFLVVQSNMNLKLPAVQEQLFPYLKDGRTGASETSGVLGKLRSFWPGGPKA